MRRSLSLHKPKKTVRDSSGTRLKIAKAANESGAEEEKDGQRNPAAIAAGLRPLKKVSMLRPKSLQASDDTAKAQGKIRKILARNELRSPEALGKMSFAPSDIIALARETLPLTAHAQGKPIRLRRNVPMMKSSVLKAAISEELEINVDPTAGAGPANMSGSLRMRKGL
jgi:hypothetical protein